jgi:hypothetical protein
MSVVTTTLVAIGIGLSVFWGLARGFDAVSIWLVALIVLAGALAIAVARKSSSGAVMPETCSSCGGLVSASAPYCKHCGRSQARRSF